MKVKDAPTYGETAITVDPRMTDTANENVTATATGTSVEVVNEEIDGGSTPPVKAPVDLYVNYTEEQKAATVYSIDVVWEEDLAFDYVAGAEGVWDPANHSYKDAAVAEWKDNTANVTVTNHSNAKVLATVDVTDTDGEDGVTVEPNETSATLESAVGVAVADADAVTFTFTAKGTPVETVSTVASVTISFAGAND